jgi:hypothetical protein
MSKDLGRPSPCTAFNNNMIQKGSKKSPIQPRNIKVGTKVTAKTNNKKVLLRLIMSIAMSLGADPEMIAEIYTLGADKEFAEALHDYLDEDGIV